MQNEGKYPQRLRNQDLQSIPEKKQSIIKRTNNTTVNKKIKLKFTENSKDKNGNGNHYKLLSLKPEPHSGKQLNKNNIPVIITKPTTDQGRKICYLNIGVLKIKEKPNTTNNNNILRSSQNSNDNQKNKEILPIIPKQNKKENGNQIKRLRVIKINNNPKPVSKTEGNQGIVLKELSIRQNGKPFNPQIGLQIPKKGRILLLKQPKTYSPTEPGQQPNNSIKDYSYRENQNSEIRKLMEDFHYINSNLTQKKNETVSFFGIYDGHNGSNPAIFCQQNLHKVLVKFLHELDFEIEKSLLKTFVVLDSQLKNVPNSQESGTTATVGLVYKNAFYCANVGDSCCFIIQEDNCIKMTRDHNCLDSEEVNRITKSAGRVFNKRVFGSLEITRALGDLEMKQFGVIPDPSILKHDITEKDKYAIIASDGVWTVLSQNDILKQVRKNRNQSTDELCEWVVSSSISNYSKDNISCIVVKF